MKDYNKDRWFNFFICLLVCVFVFGMTLTYMTDVEAQEVTTRYIAPESNTQPGFEYELSWNWDDYNIWASHASFDHIMVTQSVGDVQVNGVGFGIDPEISEGLRFFLDIGVGFSSTDFRQEVLEEGIYYTFQPTFGHPSFLKDGLDGGAADWRNFYLLTYVNEVEEYAPLGRIGLSYSPGGRFSIGGGYYYHQLENYISMYNPDLNGGPTVGEWGECGCLWEGKEKIDFSGWMLEVKWRF